MPRTGSIRVQDVCFVVLHGLNQTRPEITTAEGVLGRNRIVDTAEPLLFILVAPQRVKRETTFIRGRWKHIDVFNGCRGKFCRIDATVYESRQRVSRRIPDSSCSAAIARGREECRE